MDNATELLLSSYYRLLELTEKQLDLSSRNRYDEQLDEVLQLENQKNDYVAFIEQLQRESIDSIGQADQREEIISIIKQLRVVSYQLEQKITIWYEDDSKMMRQVSSQRKTLQAYGGINYSDVISYYFDEKQ